MHIIEVPSKLVANHLQNDIVVSTQIVLCAEAFLSASRQVCSSYTLGN